MIQSCPFCFVSGHFYFPSLPQPNFKDYPAYMVKFKQCLSKAMFLMKSHTVNTLQNLTSQLMKRVCAMQLRLTTRGLGVLGQWTNFPRHLCLCSSPRTLWVQPVWITPSLSTMWNSGLPPPKWKYVKWSIRPTSVLIQVLIYYFQFSFEIRISFCV